MHASFQRKNVKKTYQHTLTAITVKQYYENY